MCKFRLLDVKFKTNCNLAIYAQVKSVAAVGHMPGSTNTMFLSLRFQASKILRNLQGKMGHAWSPDLSGTRALLPNLPHIREIYG